MTRAGWASCPPVRFFPPHHQVCGETHLPQTASARRCPSSPRAEPSGGSPAADSGGDHSCHRQLRHLHPPRILPHDPRLCRGAAAPCSCESTPHPALHPAQRGFALSRGSYTGERQPPPVARHARDRHATGGWCGSGTRAVATPAGASGRTPMTPPCPPSRRRTVRMPCVPASFASLSAYSVLNLRCSCAAVIAAQGSQYHCCCTCWASACVSRRR